MQKRFDLPTNGNHLQHCNAFAQTSLTRSRVLISWFQSNVWKETRCSDKAERAFAHTDPTAPNTEKWLTLCLWEKRVHSLSVGLLNAFVCICPSSSFLSENRIPRQSHEIRSSLIAESDHRLLITPTPVTEISKRNARAPAPDNFTPLHSCVKRCLIMNYDEIV